MAFPFHRWAFFAPIAIAFLGAAGSHASNEPLIAPECAGLLERVMDAEVAEFRLKSPASPSSMRELAENLEEQGLLASNTEREIIAASIGFEGLMTSGILHHALAEVLISEGAANAAQVRSGVHALVSPLLDRASKERLLEKLHDWLSGFFGSGASLQELMKSGFSERAKRLAMNTDEFNRFAALWAGALAANPEAAMVAAYLSIQERPDAFARGAAKAMPSRRYWLFGKRRILVAAKERGSSRLRPRISPVLRGLPASAFNSSTLQRALTEIPRIHKAHRFHNYAALLMGIPYLRPSEQGMALTLIINEALVPGHITNEEDILLARAAREATLRLPALSTADILAVRAGFWKLSLRSHVSDVPGYALRLRQELAAPWGAEGSLDAQSLALENQTILQILKSELEELGEKRQQGDTQSRLTDYLALLGRARILQPVQGLELLISLINQAYISGTISDEGDLILAGALRGYALGCGFDETQAAQAREHLRTVLAEYAAENGPAYRGVLEGILSAPWTAAGQAESTVPTEHPDPLSLVDPEDIAGLEITVESPRTEGDHHTAKARLRLR